MIKNHYFVKNNNKKKGPRFSLKNKVKKILISILLELHFKNNNFKNYYFYYSIKRSVIASLSIGNGHYGSIVSLTFGSTIFHLICVNLNIDSSIDSRFWESILILINSVLYDADFNDSQNFQNRASLLQPTML